MSESERREKPQKKVRIWRDANDVLKQTEPFPNLGLSHTPAVIPGEQKSFNGTEGIPSLFHHSLGIRGVRGLRDKEDPNDPDTAPSPVKITKAV